MSEQVSQTDECPDCGWQAFVTYLQARAWGGKVVHRAVLEVRCTNPDCEHYTAKGSTAGEQHAASTDVEPSSKRRLTKRQRDAFVRREGEDAYEWVTRTHRTLRFRDLPQVLMLRNEDRKQVEAIQLLAQLKMVQWTRALTFGTLVLGACTIVAALIARS